MPNDATTYRLFGLDYFDSVLLTGDYQKTDIRFLEEQRGINKKDLVTVGCPYLDVYKENIAKVPEEENHPFTVLVSPSWGDVGILKKYGENFLILLQQQAGELLYVLTLSQKNQKLICLHVLKNATRTTKILNGTMNARISLVLKRQIL